MRHSWWISAVILGAACTGSPADDGSGEHSGSGTGGTSAGTGGEPPTTGAVTDDTGPVTDGTGAPTGTSGETGASAEATAEIVFPPPSATVAATLPVRGTASADAPVVAVRVAGVAATSSDGFATWRVDVPLALGDNTLAVDVETAGGTEVAAASVVVTRAADYANLARGAANRFGEVFDGIYSGSENIAWDPVARRVLVVDNWGDGIYAIDPLTGDHTTISYSEENELHRGVGADLTAPKEGAYFPDLDVTLVTDSAVLFSIDMPSGDRSVLGDFQGMIDADDVLLDPATGDAIVMSYVDQSVWRVDPVDGARTLLSGLGVGAGPALHSPTSMVLDEARGRLLFTQQYVGSLAAVDLATGDRPPFSPEGAPGPASDDPARLAISTVEDEAYMFEDDGDPTKLRLLGIDLATGARRTLAMSADDGMDPVPLDGLATYEHGILVMSGYALFVLDPVEEVKVVVSR